MTRDEALAYGKNYYIDLITACCEIDEKHKEFVRMSLEALEQEPKYCDRNICLRNEYNGIGCNECEVTKSQEPCEDAISRSEAIKAIDERAKKIKNGDTLNGLAGAVGILFELPSVKQKDCDTCEVGNPCLYCKHEFEPQERSDKE